MKRIFDCAHRDTLLFTKECVPTNLFKLHKHDVSTGDRKFS